MSDAPWQALIDVAAHSISRHLGAAIELGPNKMPSPARHQSIILRCPVIGEAGATSVIVKQFTEWLSLPGEERAAAWRRRFNPDSSLFSTPLARFEQERAGLAFVPALPGSIRAPRLLGDDPTELVVVVEDLGDQPTLYEPLAGNDPVAAREGVLALARTMARLHGASLGQGPEFGRRSGRAVPADHDLSLFERGLSECLSAARDYGIEIGGGLVDEVGQLRAHFHQENLAVFSPGDVGPGNQFLIDGDVVLFDFEYSRFRPLAIEVGNLLMPFPCVWTSAAIPVALLQEVEHAYFDEIEQHLGPIHSEARDRLVVSGIAWWALATVGADLQLALREDYQWGLTSCRQRHVHKLRLLARTSDERARMPELAAFANRLADRLSSVWAVEPPSAYPAFAGR